MHEQSFKNILDGFINTPAQLSVIMEVLQIFRKAIERKKKILWRTMVYLCIKLLVFPILKGQ